MVEIMKTASRHPRMLSIVVTFILCRCLCGGIEFDAICGGNPNAANTELEVNTNTLNIKGDH